MIRWRIDDDRAVGRKAQKVAVITVDEGELEHLADLAEDAGHVEIELRAAHAALLRAQREGGS